MRQTRDHAQKAGTACRAPTDERQKPEYSMNQRLLVMAKRLRVLCGLLCELRVESFAGGLPRLNTKKDESTAETQSQDKEHGRE